MQETAPTRANHEPPDSFRIFPAIITMLLMMLFVGSTIYVLISCLA